MSKELGIGVPVWIGWMPELAECCSTDPRLKRGVVNDGPFLSGVPRRNMSGVIIDNISSVTFWGVESAAGNHLIPEPMLTPIDDDDGASEREAEKPREVEHV